MAKILYLLALCPLYLAAITFPGVSGYLSQAASINFVQQYLPFALSTAESTPTFNYTSSFLFTSMKFEFYNVNFNNLQVNPDQISLSFDSVVDYITMNISQPNLVVSANFTLHWFGTYRGWTSFNFTDAIFSIPTEIGANRNKATFEFRRMSITYSSYRFKFYSNNAFLSTIGLLEYIWGFESIFNSIVLGKMKSLLMSQNNKISAYLNNLPYKVYVGNESLAINYSPIDIDVTRDRGIQFNLVGEAFINKDNKHSPYKMNSFLPWVINTDIRIQLTDYFLNTYLWSLTTLGNLNYTFSQMTYPNLADAFTTTGMQLLVPGLLSTYGPDLPVSVVASLLPYPSVSLYSGSAKASGTLSFGFYVQTDIDASVLALCFNTNVTTELGLWFEEIDDIDYLYYEIYVNSTEFTGYQVTQSTIGTPDLSDLQGAINWAIESLILFVNPKLAIYRIQLPVPTYLSITQGQVVAASRNVQVGGKVNFKFR